MIGRPLPSAGVLLLTVATGFTPGVGAAAAPSPGTIERRDPRIDRLVPPGAVLEKVADGFTWIEGPVWRDGVLLLARDGKVIGAIGVSGNTPQEDEEIARAGAEAFR